MAKPKNSQFTNRTIRFNPSDRQVIELLSRKLGVGLSQVVRMGLRALADKEGLRA